MNLPQSLQFVHQFSKTFGETCHIWNCCWFESPNVARSILWYLRFEDISFTSYCVSSFLVLSSSRKETHSKDVPNEFINSMIIIIIIIIIIIVIASTNHKKGRPNLRSSWRSYRCGRMLLVGTRCHSNYGHLFLGSFRASFRSSSYRHLLGMFWSRWFLVPSAIPVFLVDDVMLV